MNDVALKVLKKISDSGYEAYLVGGYPRDFYMGKDTSDYDICTNATPKDIKEIFSNSILKREQYGSVTIYFDDVRFEITTFRKDIKYFNNRKPIEIEYVDSLLEDLKRRDFTMNTMCIDYKGNLIDILNGRNDINNKIIKTVGDPYKKIEEDSLRILRAIRFATVLDFELDAELIVAIKRYKYLLKNLSYYRKKEELDKIFSSQNCNKGIDLIIKLELDIELEIPNIRNIVPTKYLDGIWAQLDVLEKYTFNSTQKDTILKIRELMNLNVLNPNNIYKYGLYISTIVAEIKNIDIQVVNEIYNSLQIYNRDEINISAMEICETLNKAPGKHIKEIYNDLEFKIINNYILNDKETIKKYIKENYMD